MYYLLQLTCKCILFNIDILDHTLSNFKNLDYTSNIMTLYTLPQKIFYV